MTQIPFFIDIRLHPPVLLFTIGVAVLTTLISGAIPAYQSSRADINEILKDETRGASSFRIGQISKALVMFEIALSCGLLVAAGLMIKSVTKMRNDGSGLHDEERLHRAHRIPGRVHRHDRRSGASSISVAERVSALPGVQSASISSGLPAARQGFGGNNFAVEGQTYLKDKDYPNARWLSVTPDFFTTLKSPIARRTRVHDQRSRRRARRW